jgi:hypothetical protein
MVITEYAGLDGLEHDQQPVLTILSRLWPPLASNQLPDFTVCIHVYRLVMVHGR